MYPQLRCSYYICESFQLSTNRMQSTVKCINPRLSSSLFRVYLFIYLLHLYELQATVPVPLQWPAQRPFVENIIFCWILRDSALIMYLFNFSDWDPTVAWVIIRCKPYGQRVEYNLCWPNRLIETYWSKRKETAFRLSMLAFPDSLISDVYINSLTNSSLFWRGK